MDLWTEFQGVTIDSAFLLTKLVQSEGRSAFFSTLNAKGESVLIRIIECHFDEDEILARWRGVQALGNPNFLGIDRFGQCLIEDEGITAVYAVFERVEENLGEVLERGRLSPADATQIALSVCSALESLHDNGFVHGHIETRNIYAVAGDVKLRSDCVREIPEGKAGMEARLRDVQQLAAVLTQVLAGAPRGWQPPQPLLPPPFDEIVPNAMNGSWGLAEIKAALGRRDLPATASQSASTAPESQTAPASLPVLPAAAPSAAQAAPLPASLTTARDAAAGYLPTPLPLRQQAVAECNDDCDLSMGQENFDRPSMHLRHLALEEEWKSKPVPQPSHFKPRPARSEAQASPFASPGANPAAYADYPRRKPAPMKFPAVLGLSERDFRKWIGVGALLLGVVLIGWMVLHHWLGQRSGAAAERTSAESTAAGSPPRANPSVAKSTPAAHAASGSQLAAKASAAGSSSTSALAPRTHRPPARGRGTPGALWPSRTTARTRRRRKHRRWRNGIPVFRPPLLSRQPAGRHGSSPSAAFFSATRRMSSRARHAASACRAIRTLRTTRRADCNRTFLFGNRAGNSP